MQSSVIRVLRETLTREEREARASVLARELAGLEQDKEAKKAMARASKEAIEAREAKVAKLRDAVDSNSEEREIECYERFNRQRRCIELVRKDVDRVVEERQPTEDELQSDFRFETEQP